MFDSIFLQLSIVFGITASLAFFVRWLRQPFLIAYIFAGIVAGPFVLNFIQKGDEAYHIFSQFGVVLLLFVVGLSLNFHSLKKIGKVSLITGITQAFITAGLSFVLLRFFSLSVFSAGYISLAITFSSTIIITKLLSDKKDTESVYGRYTIGLMLVQDLIAIGLMIFLVNGKNSDMVWTHSIGLLIIKVGILISCIYILSKFIVPFLLNKIARSSEFLFLFTVAWCFGIASLVNLMGLSLEIGAIFAGLSLGSSPYQPEISSRIRPLRDFFLILFFIILGSELTFSNFQFSLVPALALSVFVLLCKPLVLFFLFRGLQFTRRNSFLSATTAAQVSEFGFILLFTGQQMGYVGQDDIAIFTLVAIITIFFSSYLITYNEQVYRFCLRFFSVFGKDKIQQPEEVIPVYDAWVIGYHRMGWKVCETLKQQKISFAVLDFNPEIIKKLQLQKVPAYFGDVADVEFLSELPFKSAKYIISTIPEVDDQFTFIQYVRSVNPKTFIIANLHHIQYLKDFYKAGADYVMMPHFLGGYRISEILRSKNLSRTTFKKLRKEQEIENQLRLKSQVKD